MTLGQETRWAYSTTLPELTWGQTLQKSAGSYRSSMLKYFMSQHSEGLHPMSIMSTDLY